MQHRGASQFATTITGYARVTRMICAGILLTGSTRSTSPVAIALQGTLSYSASAGSCAITTPPFSLIALMPPMPSEPEP